MSIMSEHTLSEVPTRKDELPPDLLALRTSNAEKGVNIIAQTPSRPYSYREDETVYDRFTPGRKRIITAIVSFAGLGINLASLLVLSALPEVAAAFNTTGTVINFTNALFLLMMGIGVLFWGPLSQVYGRKWIFVISTVLFCTFSLATAVSPNLPAFFIFRSITAFAGTSFLIVGSACLSDIYRPTERGTALGWFLGGTLIGPALGPFIGGVIVTYSTWKSLFWFQGALGGAAMVLAVAFLPETSHGKWSEELEGMTTKEKISQIWEWANPFRVISLFRYPKILIVAQFFTLDVISDLAFGEPFGFVASDSDMYEYIKTTEENLPVFMGMTVVPWVIRLFRYPFLRSMLPTAKDPLGFGKVMGIAKRFSAERFGPDAKVQRDMLGSFVAHGLTQEEAESEILLQIIAGSDTTATAIRATLLYIITNPRVHNKLLAEILSVYNTTARRTIISDAEARNLPYLQAVIKEGLRIFPPVAGLMAKQAPPEGDTWNGVFIPGGTRVGWSSWAMFRRPDVFGEDADEFRPERWLAGQGEDAKEEDGTAGAAEEKLREMEATIELIFSHGRYQCLGRPVALMELNKVFFELLRRLELTICDPLDPWKTFNCGIHAQSEYWIRAQRRR
ncbi:major facilitator superfamily transporter [Colletotrichum abscissum]|uniref:major facilitator superfamily transporter n=1 Tax=Colletotrichum abscissum TaxID=1671311 RepID=UPI0027D68F35|nr:major facilitator superfamily transporter [Colletotrichum abscissum]KAK1518273.1 major facilitator superfamily transporter [Colletotrichum abscissum]